MRRVRAFEAYKKVMEENRAIEEKKKTWGDADAAHTKWLLDEAIRKEQADIAREREVKERIRREAMDYQKQLEQQMIRESKMIVNWRLSVVQTLRKHGKSVKINGPEKPLPVLRY